jgi:hypothetical protein
MKHSLSALLREEIILNINRTRGSQTVPTVSLDVAEMGKILHPARKWKTDSLACS